MEGTDGKYSTVESLSEGEYQEKGSKFIGLVVSCFNEEEAKNFLEQWRKEHYKARHLCYAYKFGVIQEVYRVNDDGEPNNSAGMPIYGQIQAFGLTNVLIGVVRYYGGVKLGVGGLINAYRTAAKEAIENAIIIEKEVYEWVQLHFEYDQLPQVMSKIKQLNLTPQNQDFALRCSLTLNLPLDKAHQMKEEIVGYEKRIEIKILGKY